MFLHLGNAVARTWRIHLVGWILLLVALKAGAPDWDSLVGDGQFRYLPDDVPSRQGEELFRNAFSKDVHGSQIVIVVRRESREEGLLPTDKEFIEDVLKPRLLEIVEQEGGLISNEESGEHEDEQAALPSGEQRPNGPTRSTAPENDKTPVISNIRTFSDKALGPLLSSDDGKASLVMVELTTEFMEFRNQPIIEKIERLIGGDGEPGELERAEDQQSRIPLGLDLALSGSATVGRDMRQAAKQSASATESTTILLVIVLLVLIYRAPILALIPLVTVFIAVQVAITVLAFLAQVGMIELFTGIQVYVTVVMYGAGVDYCMFLMSRYREELHSGSTFEEAVANSIGKVGAALAASAGTTMCGIGMMVFADFGKFRQAGVAMSLSLFFVLAAALTFTPCLLRLAGRWAFWPQMRSERIAAAPGWVSPTSLVARLMEKDWSKGIWQRISELLLSKPGTVWLAAVALMLPFTVIAVLCYDELSYGLLSELPQDETSVVGARAVQDHFPAGITGPVTILVENRRLDFTQPEGRAIVDELTTRLEAHSDDMGIADVRSVSQPLGIKGFEKVTSFIQRGIVNKRAPEFYVSQGDEYGGHVARLDVIFDKDPFARDSIDQLDSFEKSVPGLLPDELRDSQIYFIGATPSIRDLKSVTNGDQVRIDLLVLLGVFLILVVLLRRPAIAGYLIISVFFSYLVALGATFAFFWLRDPAGFAGLDWKVPMFLFTILIAVGEDYNIYLITRVQEEQQRHGPVKGVTVALLTTGSIISSCGLIMAGTFSSLMAGSLVGMDQLGFALACGVLLDTFVVRPILVPAYLILLHRGSFGALGRFLGAEPHRQAELSTPLEVSSKVHE